MKQILINGIDYPSAKQKIQHKSKNRYFIFLPVSRLYFSNMLLGCLTLDPNYGYKIIIEKLILFDFL